MDPVVALRDALGVRRARSRTRSCSAGDVREAEDKGPGGEFVFGPPTVHANHQDLGGPRALAFEAGDEGARVVLATAREGYGGATRKRRRWQPRRRS